MSYKPLIVVLGEPYSTFQEIILKSFKKKIISNFRKPIIFIGSVDLFKKQMLKLGYSFKINIINPNNLENKKINNKFINFINVNFQFKKVYDKISFKSKSYIKNSFDIAIKLLKKKQVSGIINGPISKKYFLKKAFPGITEYLSKKTYSKNNPVMLIYNQKLSVSPITTHLPIKDVVKKINKKKIIENVDIINKFYREKLKKKPLIAILGLNPHCETISKYSEEEKIIIPAIKNLSKKKINIQGPFSADTFFFKKNINKYDVVIGMYHDQVLTPIKTLFNFDAINLTLGLPFVRISPDHGTNNEMLGLNKSNYRSFLTAIKFIKKIDAN